MKHPFIKRYDLSSKYQHAVTKCLLALKNHKTQQKLQEAVIIFIVGQIATREDMQECQDAFKCLDGNNDGKISQEELVVGFLPIFGDAAEEEVDKIFRQIDIDGSGFIDYSEWVIATIDKKQLFSPEKLRIAFNLFDKDGGGTISLDEVKEVLCSGQEIEDSAWNRINQELQLIDADGSGELDFEEFCIMLEKMVQDEPEAADE